MENDNPDLPPIRSIMMETQEGEGTNRWERLFYLAPLAVFFILSVVTIIGGTDQVFQANPLLFPYSTRWIAMLLVFGQGILMAWVITKQKSVSLLERAKWFQDESFTEIVEKKQYQAVIARYRSPD